MAFSQPIFWLNGTSLTPAYSRGYSQYGLWHSSGSDPQVVTDTNAGSGWSNSAIDYSGNAQQRFLTYVGLSNMPSTMASGISMLFRIDPGWSGSPSTQQGLVYVGNMHEKFELCIVVTTAGKFKINFVDASGGFNLNYTTTASLSITANTCTDIMWTYDGSATAGSSKVYQDGALLESNNPSAATAATYTNSMLSFIDFGAQGAPISAGSTNVQYKLVEAAIFDSVQTAYSARTGCLTATTGNGDTLPAVGNVRSGVAVGLNTGTYTPTYAAASNVRYGTDRGDGTPGTCYVPVAATTLRGVPVDNTTGTLDVTPPTQIVFAI